MPKKIAIIEDDLSIAEMYAFKLKSSGFHVATAANGKEGLALARSFCPDLILLDLLLPDISGDEMLEKLRATDWGASIRVVVLTNLTKDEAPMKLRFLHVERYIVKAHYTPAQVLQVVQEVLDENHPKPGSH